MKPSVAWCAQACAALACFFACAPAEAHLTSTGMGPVYDGLLHFMTSPGDLVPALALAMLAGLRGPEHGRRAMFTLPAAWLLGILTGATFAVVNVESWWAGCWLLLLGGLVVADMKLSVRALTLLSGCVGVLHGFLNGTGLGLSPPALVAAVGLSAAVFALVVLVAAFVVSLRANWARIAVRVGGSWIAASGLLMLGWSLRG